MRPERKPERTGGIRRSGIGALTLLLAFSTASSARAEIGGACRTGDFSAAIATMEAEGWNVLTADATPAPEQIEALAWILMAGYAYDQGGEEIATLLALQRRAAPGLLRRVDTDAMRSRVLTQGGDALIVTETRIASGRVQRTCRLASAVAAPSGFETIDIIDLEGAPTLAESVTILLQETEK